MTLKREQIRELAAFEDSHAGAVSFYFQPATPRNKAHKEDAILIKDLARDALAEPRLPRLAADEHDPVDRLAGEARLVIAAAQAQLFHEPRQRLAAGGLDAREFG